MEERSKCSHDRDGISTHGRCLNCNQQIFPSLVLRKAGISTYYYTAKISGRLQHPDYKKLQGLGV